MRPKFVFVFGSNKAGIHGAGAAREAYENYRAERGVGSGPTGHAYAIPTKETPYSYSMAYRDIKPYVDDFLIYARQKTNTIFFVTPIGCGLAGRDWDIMREMFKDAPDNCVGPFFYE